MAAMKKVLISLPDDLLDQLDALAEEDGQSRSEMIRMSLKQTIALRHKLMVSEAMKKGYQEMAFINREWAELGISQDEGDLQAYEDKLPERETR